MQNMILASATLSDAATITGTTGAGDLSIGNLQKMDLKAVYRVIGDTVSLTIDLLNSKEINLVALIAHNCSAAASVRVRASNTNDAGTAPYDTGLLPARSNQTGFSDSGYPLEKNMFLSFFSAQTYRYWFIDVVDTGAEYIDIGRLYISNAFQPETNMDYGLAEGVVDPSRVSRVVSGGKVPREFVKYKTADFALGYSNEAEMFGKIYALELACGRTKDVLFVPDPDAKDFLQIRSYYGTMEIINPKVNYQFSLFNKAFRIEEIPV
ncbi:hypothetical protein [Dyadobacter jiangsuensis]|uniref:Uncharacterized protein n=1 Tax=Dyadobacter jiangsuensis TaxID=1591085 RepID=A0A2P8FP21_9BACT|nr:hypothetical protein [Dyadobacter jiangsuensis]PSL23480.1 hypothetical protein CLV60_11635 [Dyadobacter jiangsuensis]